MGNEELRELLAKATQGSHVCATQAQCPLCDAREEAAYALLDNAPALLDAADELAALRARIAVAPSEKVFGALATNERNEQVLTALIHADNDMIGQRVRLLPEPAKGAES